MPEDRQIPVIGRTTREKTAKGIKEPSIAYSLSPALGEERVVGLDALVTSSYKCVKNVSYKSSVQRFMLHLIESVLDLNEALMTGTYKEGPTHPVNITYPKARVAISIAYRDRVVQRSVNDVVLYPAMTSSFIEANMACQKGKGTDAARQYYIKMLRRAYINFGNNKDFVIITLDIKGYYDNMRHDLTNALLSERLSPWCAEFVVKTLDGQYKGEMGYNPGSQMVQIAGISYLDKFDHFAKEVLRLKYYIRYMDDIHIVVPKEEAQSIIDRCRAKLAEYGLSLHPVKTRIHQADEGALFLGFKHRVTKSGKILIFRDPEKVKENRRHLRGLAKLVIKGERTREDFETAWECILSFLKKGNSKRLIRKMKEFVAILRKDIDNAEHILSTAAERHEASCIGNGDDSCQAVFQDKGGDGCSPSRQEEDVRCILGVDGDSAGLYGAGGMEVSECAVERFSGVPDILCGGSELPWLDQGRRGCFAQGVSGRLIFGNSCNCSSTGVGLTESTRFWYNTPRQTSTGKRGVINFEEPFISEGVGGNLAP